MTPWDDEVALFDREIAAKQVSDNAKAAKKRTQEANTAAYQRAETRMGLVPPPAQILANLHSF